eukprot:1144132-Pelagomonas_calceolata.AAC.3
MHAMMCACERACRDQARCGRCALHCQSIPTKRKASRINGAKQAVAGLCKYAHPLSLNSPTVLWKND